MEIGKYQELIEKASNKVETYENLGLDKTVFSLFLANGDNINVKTFPNNISHLLGINIEYLKQSNKLNKDWNNFRCLKEFLEKSYSFQLLVRDGLMSFDKMFSDYVDEKFDALITNIKVRTDNMLYIIKYDGERTYQTEEIHDVCDYYLVRKIFDEYYVLGVKLNENYYVPVTNRKYDEVEYKKFISKIAKKQEITYPYLLKINNASNNYNNSITTYQETKKEYVERILEAAKEYDATAAVGRDFLFQMNNTLNERNKKDNNKALLQLLRDTIISGNILDNDSIRSICGQIEIPYEIRQLINACNDRIVNNSSSGDLDISYSELLEEKDRMKRELEELKQEIIELKNDNNNLKENNEVYKEQFEIIEKAVQNIKK